MVLYPIGSFVGNHSTLDGRLSFTFADFCAHNYEILFHIGLKRKYQYSTYAQTNANPTG